MLRKPDTCQGCPLFELGQGFAPASGPHAAEMLFVGEALGEDEVPVGKPFVGAAGSMLDRLFHRTGIDRKAVTIHNVVSCRPPGNKLVGEPYEKGAIEHCSQYLETTISGRPRVIVALGATAARNLLPQDLQPAKMDHLHGLPIIGRHRIPIVTTYHPAFLLRGNFNLMGVSLFDIRRAQDVAAGKWKPEGARLLVDPPFAEFKSWCERYLELDGGEFWLAVDIETPKKIDEEDERELEILPIIRINLSYNPYEGLTVPWQEPYITEVKALLATPGVRVVWNRHFDLPILASHGCEIAGPVLDFMDGWHVLQSDVPRGLGFVAPFYSSMGAWKHLASIDAGTYAAVDAVQTIRCAYGIANDLNMSGQWDTFYRHHAMLDPVLHSASRSGLLLASDGIEMLSRSLGEKREEIWKEINASVPEAVKPLSGFWKREPKDKPGAFEVDTDLGKRWVIREDFNPASPKQVLAYMQYKKHTGGKGKDTKRAGPSADELVLTRLAKKDNFYRKVLDYREIDKVLGTYVKGMSIRSEADGRLHPTFLHNPSTGRLSCQNPNIQNVVGNSGALAASFRRCIVAAPEHYLVESDFSGIEAVEVGWFSGDPSYIRLAKLGVHAFLASHLLGEPADLKWSDEDLVRYFEEIKGNHKDVYNMAKRCVHGTAYGLTPFGMVNNYPDVFTRATATQTQQVYFQVCPKLQGWQSSVRDRAVKQGYLGGNDHPFGYKHWFWNVYNYNGRTGEVTLGEDAKRAVAFYPQSSAAGVLYEAVLALHDRGGDNYIGDLCDGRTPLRALIHDSILSEVPDNKLEEYLEKVTRAMSAPILQQPMPESWGLGEFLRIGVETKVGRNWGVMEVVK